MHIKKTQQRPQIQQIREQPKQKRVNSSKLSYDSRTKSKIYIVKIKQMVKKQLKLNWNEIKFEDYLSRNWKLGCSVN